MSALRRSAELLAAANSLDSLVPLANAIGMDAAPVAVDADLALALGFPPGIEAASMVAGRGALRALLLECNAGAPLRDTITRLAARLVARTPQLLWIVIATNRRDVGIATWSADRQPPRVAALLADRSNLVDSDAETLAALSATSGALDLLAHARWLEILGREALTRRFYRTLGRLVGDLARDAQGRARAEERSEIALLYASRLLFLSFLEAKGWLDNDRGFLLHRFDACMAARGGYHQRVLRPLFFGTLNTPLARRARLARAFGRIPFLNGGLFARTPVERRCANLVFSDAALGALHGDLLARYRFTAREDALSWSEAAVDPEMLGKAFEQLMAEGDRKASGSFYTPQAIVASLSRSGLANALSCRDGETQLVERLLDGDAGAAAALTASKRSEIRTRATSIRVLDPACGSGAFLVHALEQLAALLRTLGDDRPIADVRREILTRSIFGVDVNPTAVWLCELRLWLSVVIERDEPDPMRVPPLPNLDHHVRVGDALAGDAFGATPARGRSLARLRERYARATGVRKRGLERALGAAERLAAKEAATQRLRTTAAERRSLLAAARGRDLFGERHPPARAMADAIEALRVRARALRASLRTINEGGALPFSWETHFVDAAAAGGFDLVLGNPPWVRIHHIPAPQRAEFRARFAVLREPGWQRGAALAGAGRGFAAQVDLSALFVERSLALTRGGGVVGLLLPVKLWSTLASGALRELVARQSNIIAIEDWSASRPAFDAAVYPSSLVARVAERDRALNESSTRLVIHHRDVSFDSLLPRSRLALDDSSASPWLLLPPDVRAAFDRVAAAGTPLAESPLGRPVLGVKSGCNEAFIIAAGGAAIDRDLLRPVLRGEHVTSWRARTNGERIVWTHGEDGAPLRVLSPSAARHFAAFRSTLQGRSDLHGARWWSLFRTAAADTRRWRVVWSDFGKTPRAAVLAPGDRTVPLNTCYVLPLAQRDDALAFAALLNSPLAAVWLGCIAEPARGGFHRYLGWSMALLPIPHHWTEARAPLATLASSALDGLPPSRDALLDAALTAFDLRHQAVADLLAWSAR